MGGIADATYRVDAVRLGGWDWAPGFELFWMDFDAPDEPLALVGVVIRGGGVTALVNTGPDPAFVAKVAAEAPPGQKHVLLAGAEEHPAAALGRLGIGLADVPLVLMTPFRAYAIGNGLRFPNAEICLSRRGWIDFHAPAGATTRTTSGGSASRTPCWSVWSPTLDRECGCLRTKRRWHRACPSSGPASTTGVRSRSRWRRSAARFSPRTASSGSRT